MYEGGQTEHLLMPLYYLHIEDGAELLLDSEGSNLPNLEAARIEAIEGARQLISQGYPYRQPASHAASLSNRRRRRAYAAERALHGRHQFWRKALIRPELPNGSFWHKR